MRLSIIHPVYFPFAKAPNCHVCLVAFHLIPKILYGRAVYQPSGNIESTWSGPYLTESKHFRLQSYLISTWSSSIGTMNLDPICFTFPLTEQGCVSLAFNDVEETDACRHPGDIATQMRM